MREAHQRGAIALTQALVVAVVVTGGVLGVALQQGGVFGGGDETIEVALDAVPVTDCPDGSDVGDLHRGDRVFATGRDESGDWVEVRDPAGLSGRVWLRAQYLLPDADLSALDVHECAVAEAAVTTTTGPTGSLPPNVTTTTKKGAPAPVPADTTAPTITGVSATPNEIWEQDTASLHCGTKPRQATINASANDPSGVASLTASWAFGSVNQTKNIPAQFGPFPYLTVPDNTHPTITIAITARDTRGNTSTATTTVVVHSTAECFV